MKEYGYGCLMRRPEEKAVAQTRGSIGEYDWDDRTGNYITINPEKNMVLLFLATLRHWLWRTNEKGKGRDLCKTMMKLISAQKQTREPEPHG